MRITTAIEVKATWDAHLAAYARRIERLTAIQRQAVQIERPTVECTIQVVDVWPGTGAPYPHPLTGTPDATALITGLLRPPVKKQWLSFPPNPVRAVALVFDELHRDWIVNRARGDEVVVRGILAWIDEYGHLIGGGHQCFGQSTGGHFTFRVENATVVPDA